MSDNVGEMFFLSKPCQCPCESGLCDAKTFVNKKLQFNLLSLYVLFPKGTNEAILEVNMQC